MLSTLEAVGRLLATAATEADFRAARIQMMATDRGVLDLAVVKPSTGSGSAWPGTSTSSTARSRSR